MVAFTDKELQVLVRIADDMYGDDIQLPVRA